MASYFPMFENYHRAAADFANGDMEVYGRLMYIICTYGLDGVELEELEPVEKLFLTSVKASIDKSIELSETRAKAGKRGGETKKTPKTQEETDEAPAEETSKDFAKAKNNLLKQKNICLKQKKLCLNEREREEEGENEREREREFIAPPESGDSAELSPSQFSHDLFDLFNSAGLPCANGDFNAFYSSDVQKTTAFIWENRAFFQNITNDDLYKACQNYIEVLKDPACFIKNKYSLEHFVRLKNFSDFLPANFVKQNFLLYGKTEAPPKADTAAPVIDPLKGKKAPKTCPYCGGTVSLRANAGEFVAVGCNSCASWAEFDPEGKRWEWVKREAVNACSG